MIDFAAVCFRANFWVAGIQIPWRQLLNLGRNMSRSNWILLCLVAHTLPLGPLLVDFFVLKHTVLLQAYRILTRLDLAIMAIHNRIGTATVPKVRLVWPLAWGFRYWLRRQWIVKLPGVAWFLTTINHLSTPQISPRVLVSLWFCRSIMLLFWWYLKAGS